MDNPTTIVSQANEYAYGPAVDTYAQKYGIPTDVFRGLIGGISGFDPSYKGNNGNGRGIAGLGFSGTNPDMPNPDDVSSSLDFAGNMLSSLYKSSGSWDAATKMFTTGTPEETAAAQKAADADPNSLGNKISDKITGYFKTTWTSLLIIAVGVILILGSTWIVINSGNK